MNFKKKKITESEGEMSNFYRELKIGGCKPPPYQKKIWKYALTTTSFGIPVSV